MIIAPLPAAASISRLPPPFSSRLSRDIAVALITGRWALNRIRMVFEHHGALPHPAHDQPH
jgi:hypothetical protein